MRAFLSMLAMLASLTAVDAISVVPLPFPDLVQQSQVVVYGRVAEVQGRWTDDRQAIDSLVTVQVIEYFKGLRGETIVFKVPGGHAGGMVNVLPGAPEFREGDLVVLFLASRGPALPGPVGLTQGVFRVMVDPRSGQLLVSPPPVDLQGAAPGRIVRGDHRRHPVSLSTLGGVIRALAEAQR
jgi:hypothetical protein